MKGEKNCHLTTLFFIHYSVLKVIFHSVTSFYRPTPFISTLSFRFNVTSVNHVQLSRPRISAYRDKCVFSQGEATCLEPLSGPKLNLDLK